MAPRHLAFMCFAAGVSGIRLGILGARGRSDLFRAAIQTREADAVLAPQTTRYASTSGLSLHVIHEDATAVAPLAIRPGPLNLLKQYGGVYVVTSLTLSTVSFALFYLLASRGLDVRAMLRYCGIRLGDRAGSFSTVCVAYFAHKAASPLRFVPTVALTPRVARTMHALFGTEQKGSSLVERVQL